MSGKIITPDAEVQSLAPKTVEYLNKAMIYYDAATLLGDIGYKLSQGEFTETQYQNEAFGIFEAIDAAKDDPDRVRDLAKVFAERHHAEEEIKRQAAAKNEAKRKRKDKK